MSFRFGKNPSGETKFIDCDTIGCNSVVAADSRFLSGLLPGWEKNNAAWFATCDWDDHSPENWRHYCPLHRPLNNIPEQIKSPGLQSEITTCFKRLDPKAMLALGRVLAFGENKYEKGKHTKPGQENWRKIPHEDHFDHALEHLFNYQREQIYGLEDGDEDAGQHLEHAFCRIMFALAIPPESAK